MKSPSNELEEAAALSGWVEFDALTPEQQEKVRNEMTVQLTAQSGEDEIFPLEDRVKTALGEYLFQPISADKVWRKVKPHIVEAKANVPAKPVKPSKKKTEKTDEGGTRPGVSEIGPPSAGPVPVIEMITRAKIMPGPNPRTNFDPERIAELRASMKARGFDPLFPLLVREIEWKTEPGEAGGGYDIQLRRGGVWVSVWELIDKPVSTNWHALITFDDLQFALAWLPKYELACGERRWTSAGDEKIEQVPCIVRALTDRQMLEIALVENLQREALNAMEEAQGYKRMMELKDEAGAPVHTVASAAKVVGKSETHLRECLALCRLGGSKVGEALESGQIGITHGKLLAGVPSEAEREELLAEVLHPRYGGGAMPKRELEKKISLDYKVELRGAPFDPEDAVLVPVVLDMGERMKGGACGDCPWNTANKGEKNSRNHLCLNPECFRDKTAASHNAWAAANTDPEKKIRALTFEENAGIFHSWNGTSLNYSTPYLELKDSPPQHMLRNGGKAKIWKQLIKGRDVEVVLARDKNGKTVELADKKLAMTAALENDKEKPAKERTFPDEKSPQEAASATLAEQVKQLRARERGSLIEKRERLALVNGAKGKQLPDEALRLALASLCCEVLEYNGDAAEVAARFGFVSTNDDDNSSGYLQTAVKKMDRAEMNALLIDIALELGTGSEQTGKALNVDLKKIRKDSEKLFDDQEKEFVRIRKANFVKQMDAAKTAEQARVIMSDHEKHINALQQLFGLPQRCKSTGFSCVKDKEWKEEFQAMDRVSMAGGIVLKALVAQGVEFRPRWETLHKEEVGRIDKPEKDAEPKGLSEEGRKKITAALEKRWAANSKKAGGK